MASLQMTVNFLLILFNLQIIIATSRQFSFNKVDRNAKPWQRIRRMQCTQKLFQDDFQGIMSCLLLSTYDKQSFMVGMNASHCILCYYQVNGATLIASAFQGNFLFKRGLLKFKYMNKNSTC